MTLKEKLHRAIDTLPDEQLSIALEFIETLNAPADSENPDRPASTGASLLAHIQNPDNRWVGDDIQECLEAVRNSRGAIVFKPNPFDPIDSDNEISQE